jgi:hypothetical protein
LSEKLGKRGLEKCAAIQKISAPTHLCKSSKFLALNALKITVEQFMTKICDLVVSFFLYECGEVQRTTRGELSHHHSEGKHAEGRLISLLIAQFQEHAISRTHL